jgi:hypothetical protein
VGISRNEALRGTPIATFFVWLAPVILLSAFVPFFLTKCPQCRERFHSLVSLFRSAQDPAPCASCGFNINRHLPRYGNLSTDA